MHAKLIWKENLQFTAEADGTWYHGCQAAGRPGKAQTPKQLLLAPCAAAQPWTWLRSCTSSTKNERFEVTSEAPVARAYSRLYSAP